MGFYRIIPTKIKSSFYLLIPKTIADIANVNDHTQFLIKISYGARSPNITIVQQKTKKKRSSKKKRRRGTRK